MSTKLHKLFRNNWIFCYIWHLWHYIFPSQFKNQKKKHPLSDESVLSTKSHSVRIEICLQGLLKGSSILRIIRRLLLVAPDVPLQRKQLVLYFINDYFFLYQFLYCHVPVFLLIILATSYALLTLNRAPFKAVSNKFHIMNTGFILYDLCSYLYIFLLLHDHCSQLFY